MEYRLKRTLTTPLILLAALVLWFWEWLWEPLQLLMARLGRLPVLRQLETLAAGAPPYLALCLFILPGLALLPFKLAGLYFIAHGKPLLGLSTFMAAKVVGTALVARLFTLTRTQLLAIGWFARSYTALLHFKAFVADYLHRHPAYRRIRAALLHMRRRIRQVRRGIFYHLRCRWLAIVRLSRRRGRLTCF